MASVVEYPRVPQVRAFTGAAGSGKTRALVEAVAASIEGGAKTGDVLVVCARESAIGRMRGLLEARLDAETAASVRVNTARQLELAVLATPGACAFYGRDLRALAAFEEPFYQQDMLTCGLKQRRLREMLRFFDRCVTELDDRDPAWLVSEEEREVWALSQDSLAFMGAVHPAHLSNLAFSYVEKRPEAREAVGAAHLFVDDFDRCNRASQLFLACCAESSLTVCFDRGAALTGDDPHPYLAGLDELLAAHPEAEIVELKKPAGSEAGASGRAADLPGDTGRFKHVSWQDPAAEFAGVARMVANRVAGGMNPGAVFVAVPNRTWARNVTRALETLGVPCVSTDECPTIPGDLRDLESSRALQVYCGLRLAANPDEPLVWRCWCGFGDYLGGSLAIAHLRTRFQPAGRTLPQALGDLAGSDGAHANTPEMRCLTERYRMGCELLNTASDKVGTELLEAISAFVGCIELPHEIARLVGSPSEIAGLDASALVEHIDAALAPRPLELDHVMVGQADALVGQRPQLVVTCGFVNGFVPSHAYFDPTRTTPAEQERELGRAVARFRAVAGKASGQAVFSSFKTVGLDDAKRLDLKADRIGVINGKRSCRVSPSVVLERLVERP